MRLAVRDEQAAGLPDGDSMTMGAAVSPRGQRRRNRRDELLRAATEVFFAHGLRDGTMDHVAAQAGVAKVILYRHFTSKEDLIHEILSRAAGRLLQVDRQSWDGYDSSARRALSAAREDPQAFLLLQRDARFDPVFSVHCHSVRCAIADRLDAAFRTLNLDPRLCRHSAEAITHYFLDAIANWVATGEPADDELFLRWLATGSRALDKKWRQNFTRPPDTADSL